MNNKNKRQYSLAKQTEQNEKLIFEIKYGEFLIKPDNPSQYHHTQTWINTRKTPKNSITCDGVYNDIVNGEVVIKFEKPNHQNTKPNLKTTKPVKSGTKTSKERSIKITDFDKCIGMPISKTNPPYRRSIRSTPETRTLFDGDRINNELICKNKNRNGTKTQSEKILDKKDERLCNFVWCYLKWMNYEFRDRLLLPIEQNLCRGIRAEFKYNTSNHEDRFNQISNASIYTLNERAQDYFNNLAANFYSYILHAPQPKNIEEADYKWLWIYFRDAYEINENYIIRPTSNREILYSFLAMVDLCYILDPEKHKEIILRLNKAVLQKTYRKNKP